MPWPGIPNTRSRGGKVEIDGTDLLALDPNERARLGLFLAFQYPVTIPGVKVADFLRHAASNVRNPNRKEGEGLIPMRDFRRELRARMEELGIEPEFARRYLNDGFSGGEKKRMEILQLAMLAPRFAVLDETDSGLDSDAVRVVSEGLGRLAGPNMGVLIITHHERLLVFNKPQKTHVMLAGRIVETGDAELAHQLHASGYGAVRERHPDAAALEKAALEKSAGRTAGDDIGRPRRPKRRWRRPDDERRIRTNEETAKPGRRNGHSVPREFQTWPLI